MKIAKPTKLIASIVLILIFAIGFYLFLSREQTEVRVIGNLSAKDLAEIKSVVRQKQRDRLLPKMSWYTVSHLGDTVSLVRAYERERILWVKVMEDGTVKVGVGQGNEPMNGYILVKNNKWEILGAFPSKMYRN